MKKLLLSATAMVVAIILVVPCRGVEFTVVTSARMYVGAALAATSGIFLGIVLKIKA